MANLAIIGLILAVIVVLWVPACRRRLNRVRQAKDAQERKLLMEHFFHDLARLMERRIDPETEVFYEGIKGKLSYQFEEKDKHDDETEENIRVCHYSLRFIPKNFPQHYETIFEVRWNTEDDDLSFYHEFKGLTVKYLLIHKEKLESLMEKIEQYLPAQ